MMSFSALDVECDLEELGAWQSKVLETESANEIKHA